MATQPLDVKPVVVEPMLLLALAQLALHALPEGMVQERLINAQVLALLEGMVQERLPSAQVLALLDLTLLVALLPLLAHLVVLAKLLHQKGAQQNQTVSVLQAIQVQAALHVQLVHTSLQQVQHHAQIALPVTLHLELEA
jgi:hypothetical protein